MSKKWRLVVDTVNGEELEYGFDEKPRLTAAVGFGAPDMNADSVVLCHGASAGKTDEHWDVYIVLRNTVALYIQEYEEAD